MTHLRSNCAHCRDQLPRILDVRCHRDATTAHTTVTVTGTGSTLAYSDDRGDTWTRLRPKADQHKRWRFWSDPDDPDTVVKFEYTDHTITIGVERRYRARQGKHQETASVVVH